MANNDTCNANWRLDKRPLERWFHIPANEASMFFMTLSNWLRILSKTFSFFLYIRVIAEQPRIDRVIKWSHCLKNHLHLVIHWDSPSSEYNRLWWRRNISINSTSVTTFILISATSIRSLPLQFSTRRMCAVLPSQSNFISAHDKYLSIWKKGMNSDKSDV